MSSLVDPHRRQRVRMDGGRQGITALSFMAGPAGHLRETMAAWSPDSTF